MQMKTSAGVRHGQTPVVKAATCTDDLSAPAVPILADLAYQGAGPWLTTGIKRRPLQELTPTEKTVNRALAVRVEPRRSLL
ncbi:hypothetical protein GCM10010121_099830 [Streptomyces brasiliensis]|uniref:Uncharacterized protein n=1 Tax=Streptomyces brasiliensis TaxID=1954 RepID=A0A917PEG7_9ACTN|nr:hypothetical protein GCM10010121_099830 [Streptomyces brasiliensis]